MLLTRRTGATGITKKAGIHLLILLTLLSLLLDFADAGCALVGVRVCVCVTLTAPGSVGM